MGGGSRAVGVTCRGRGGLAGKVGASLAPPGGREWQLGSYQGNKEPGEQRGAGTLILLMPGRRAAGESAPSLPPLTEEWKPGRRQWLK